MKITYDREVDALYIRLADTIVTTKYIEDGIALDYDAANYLAGIEILDAAQRVHNPETLKKVLFEKVPAREIKNQVAAG
ncbi:MAG: DUF2283 domain-containing protein [Caldilineaceae bacterium]|nr:DUF2283 domain-containing protein [Caldilineaceae bacterium]MDE0336647.1 DUF2283 domain-containing protein [Caldilineaceae bacterium]